MRISGGPGAAGAIAPGVMREECDLAGKVAEARDVVEVKILKLVWPDRLLALLRCSVLCRHQLRGNLAVDDLLKDLLAFGRQFASLNLPADEVLDERLGDRGI